MYVGGSVISSVEFHGNMSLVLFMSKCPLACRYCHNVELLEDNTEKSFEWINPKSSIEKFNGEKFGIISTGSFNQLTENTFKNSDL